MTLSSLVQVSPFHVHSLSLFALGSVCNEERCGGCSDWKTSSRLETQGVASSVVRNTLSSGLVYSSPTYCEPPSYRTLLSSLVPGPPQV